MTYLLLFQPSLNEITFSLIKEFIFSQFSKIEFECGNVTIIITGVRETEKNYQYLHKASKTVFNIFKFNGPLISNDP